MYPERCLNCGVNGPIADTDLEQPNVRFGEEQTFSQPAQKTFGSWHPKPVGGAGRGAGHPGSPPFRTHRAQFGQ
jgi:hypothetical protein